MEIKRARPRHRATAQAQRLSEEPLTLTPCEAGTPTADRPPSPAQGGRLGRSASPTEKPDINVYSAGMISGMFCDARQPSEGSADGPSNGTEQGSPWLAYVEPTKNGRS